jgi:hypothetical protein
MIPTRVGGRPLKNPEIPSSCMIFLAISSGFPRADDWSWVLITSRGLVMQDETVPATPPERRLQ